MTNGWLTRTTFLVAVNDGEIILSIVKGERPPDEALRQFFANAGPRESILESIREKKQIEKHNRVITEAAYTIMIMYP